MQRPLISLQKRTDLNELVEYDNIPEYLSHCQNIEILCGGCFKSNWNLFVFQAQREVPAKNNRVLSGITKISFNLDKLVFFSRCNDANIKDEIEI